ncbi:hypothetical protein LTR17_015601 [Elasticomyces elasticus]|nr:hypothetical protein LTR17_015601 [Elasticomyces elasticus]
MRLPQDPRFEGISEYDRDAICKVFLDFYNFLASMPPYEQSDVLVPPEGGWPSITPNKMSKLDKNHTVIDLLKHLPYLNTDKRNDAKEKFKYTIIQDTEPLDYRGRMSDEALQANFNPFYGPKYVPPYGPSLGGSYKPTYAKDDPRNWRDECENETYPAAVYFDGLKNDFRNSVWLPYWDGGSFGLKTRGDPDEHEQEWDRATHPMRFPN